MKRLPRKFLAALTALLILTLSLAGCGSEKPAEGAITFETTDLGRNTVKSQDIFKEHTLTMVNLWGTYCGPCISEMPDLEVLSASLAEKDCAIIGVVLDIAGPDDQEHIGAAEEIIQYTGVTYLNLLPWENIWNDLPAQFIPTTYFINQKGQIVGEAAVGARGAEDYEELIEGLLAELK